MSSEGQEAYHEIFDPHKKIDDLDVSFQPIIKKPSYLVSAARRRLFIKNEAESTVHKFSNTKLDDFISYSTLMHRTGVSIPKVISPEVAKYTDTFPSYLYTNKSENNNNLEFLMSPRSRIPFSKQNKSLLKTNSMILQKFMENHNITPIENADNRLKLMQRMDLYQPRRIHSREADQIIGNDDLFGYNLQYRHLLRKQGNKARRRRRRGELFEEMIDMQYDFDYTKRPGYEERKKISDKVLKSTVKSKNVEELKNSKRVLEESCTSSKIRDEVKRNENAVNEDLNKTPMVSTEDQTNPTKIVRGSLLTSSLLPNCGDFQKESERKTSPKEVSKRIEVIMESDFNRVCAGNLESNFPSSSKQKKETRDRVESEHPGEEEKRTSETELEMMRRENEQIILRNQIEEENRKNEELRKKNEDLKRLIELENIKRAIEQQKKLIDQEEEKRRLELEEAERREMSSREDLFDKKDGEDETGEESPSTSRYSQKRDNIDLIDFTSPQDTENIPFVVCEDEYLEEDDEVMVVRDVNCSDNTINPTVIQSSSGSILMKVDESDLAKSGVKAEMYRKYYGIDFYTARLELASLKMPKMVTIPLIGEAEKVRCSESVKHLNSELVNMSGVGKATPKAKEVLETSRRSLSALSKTSEEPKEEINYSDIELKDLQREFNWPFDAADGVYWPILFSKESVDSNNIVEDHVKQLLTCHTYSGYYTAHQILTDSMTVEEEEKQFLDAYGEAGDEERNDEMELEEYNSKPGRFSNRTRFKLVSLEQDRDEASRLNQEAFNREVELEDELWQQYEEYDRLNNISGKEETQSRLLHEHVQSNRIDVYSKAPESYESQIFRHPGTRANTLFQNLWTREGYDDLDITIRDAALEKVWNRYTNNYENLLLQRSAMFDNVEREDTLFEEWCLTPMLASIYYQATSNNLSVFTDVEIKELEVRRRKYNDLIKSHRFTLNEMIEICQLNEIDKKVWTILYDQLISHFKEMPSLAQSMKQPELISLIHRLFFEMTCITK